MKQSDWKELAKGVFQDQSVAESFIALADSWTGSREKTFSNHENDKLAHISAYLNKQKNGEYITEVSRDKGKSSVIRRVCVGQACITVNVKGNDYVLIQPPSKENRYQWKLPGGKLHQSDRGRAKVLASNPIIKKFLQKTASEKSFYNLIESMTTTLRELNEELPFTTLLKFVDKDDQVWVSAQVNEDISKTEYKIHNNLSFIDISKPYIELNSDEFYKYKNRRPEKPGKEKYHGIRLESELINIHGNLISLSGKVDIQQSILGDDNSGKFIWLPATPSTIEHLDAAPYHALSKELIFRSLNFNSESRVITPCFHEKSLLESIIRPIKSDSTVMTLSSTLGELTDCFDLDTKKSIASDINDQNFVEWANDMANSKKNNPFALVKIKDDKINGFTFTEGLHSRNQQLAIARISGELWQRKLLPHGFRYRQVKRRDTANLFHLHNISSEIMNARIIDERKGSERGDDNSRNKSASIVDGGISSNFASRIIYPKSNPYASIDLLDLELVDLRKDYPDLFENIDALESTTNLNWKPVSRRLKAAYAMMNRVGCKDCDVEPGKPCLSDNLTQIRKEEFSLFGQQKITRMSIPNDPLSNALTVQLVNKISRLVYENEGFSEKFTPLKFPILENEQKALNNDNISVKWKELKQGKRAPTRPFVCQKRWKQCCTKLDVKGITETHLLPAGLRNKSGNKTSKGKTSAYLSTSSTEPPLVLQNQFYSILKRDLELVKNIRIKEGNLHYDNAKTRQTSNNSKNQLLIWECLTNNKKNAITTVAIDEPRDGEKINIPILRIATDEKIIANRFNFDSEDLKQSNDKCQGKIFKQPQKTNRVLEQSDRRWDWNRSKRIGDGSAGILPIITPDFSIQEAMEIASLNGVGVAISIDSWQDLGNQDYQIEYGSMDHSWYIDENLFDKSEPKQHRTFSSFVRYLSDSHQLNIKQNSVKHSRRIVGILLLKDLLKSFM
jgi:hypothetical protein